MTSRDALLAAIEALEKAKDGGRQLDGRLFLATGQPQLKRTPCVLEHNGELTVDNCVPCYTTSLDAALQLVPEGLCWRVGFGPGGLKALLGGSAAIVMRRNFVDELGKAGAETPALALCLAALRARLAMMEEDDAPRA